MKCRGLLALMLLCSAASASAQIPQKFENLKVLPADIPRDSLIGLMRNFSFATGERCVFCHVGEDSPTLAGVDFKSDEKATKRKGREMLKMVLGINQTLANLPDRGNPPIAVKCMTCHRGIARPMVLEDSLYKIAALQGGASAMMEYDSLRAFYYGRSAFDFGFQTLVRLAERLYGERKHDDAVLVLRKNTELFPRFWNSYFELGRNYEQLGRKDEAIAAYRKTLELLPQHPPSAARLRALTGGTDRPESALRR